MIKARHNCLVKRFFNWYASHLISNNFNGVKFFGVWKDNGKASLVIGNHISWWDGFWSIYLNTIFLKKEYHVMMLEEQLFKRKLFSKVGAYSINPGSRSVIESLNYTKELLSKNNNVVVLYPQGEISSLMNSTVQFQKGIERILASSEPFQILFYVAFTDYLSNKKPTLYFYLTEVEFKKYNLTELQEEYQKFYNESLTKQASIRE